MNRSNDNGQGPSDRIALTPKTMPTMTAINLTHSADAAAPYSHGIKVGNLVFVSGQGPLNYQTGVCETTDFEHQDRLTMFNVESLLKAAGCQPTDVVKVNMHLQNINDFDRSNAIYRQFFVPPRPAKTTVQSVLVAGMSVEIDAIAVRGCSAVEEMSK